MSNHLVIASLESEVTILVTNIYTTFRSLYRKGMRRPTRQQLVATTAPHCDTVFQPGVILSRIPLESHYAMYADNGDSSKMRVLALTVDIMLEWLKLRAHLLAFNPMAKELFRKLYKMRMFNPMRGVTPRRFVSLVVPVIVVECLSLQETIGSITFREKLEARINAMESSLMAVADSK